MILAVTGLERERRMVAGPGVEAVAGGGDQARLEATLDRHAGHVAGVISIGIAGGLAPALQPGRWVVADAVSDGSDTASTDPDWTDWLASRLPGPSKGLLLGLDSIVATAGEKAALHRATGAQAVDMESHIAARIARRHRLPFVAARVVCDAAGKTLPPAARVGMRADGRMDLLAVIRSLLAEPRQIPALIRTGLEAERSFRALLRGRRRLGPRLGGPNVGELPLDMV
jgi:hopanoid-associated phosphorylase